jgi:hypothetical protein
LLLPPPLLLLLLLLLQYQLPAAPSAVLQRAVLERPTGLVLAPCGLQQQLPQQLLLRLLPAVLLQLPRLRCSRTHHASRCAC